jgi:predicted glycosyltransferase
MGVLACSRSDCERIMCDHLICDSTRYICTDCLDELEEMQKTWPKRMTAVEVKEKFDEFFASPTRSVKKLEGEELEEEIARMMRNTQYE